MKYFVSLTLTEVIWTLILFPYNVDLFCSAHTFNSFFGLNLYANVIYVDSLTYWISISAKDGRCKKKYNNDLFVYEPTVFYVLGRYQKVNPEIAVSEPEF